MPDTFWLLLYMEKKKLQSVPIPPIQEILPFLEPLRKKNEKHN